MTSIKLSNDYGYSPASPFWLVYAEQTTAIEQIVERHPDKDSAEHAAARYALAFPGHQFHALACAATVETDPVVVGKRFDPRRTPPVEAAIEPNPAFAEVEVPVALPHPDDEPL